MTRAATGTPLAEQAVRGALDAGEIPTEVLDAARLHLLDSLGVGLAAARIGPVRGVAAHAEAFGGNGRCTVIGRPALVTAPAAALVNGTLIHSLEYDDTHVAAVMHGSSVLSAAALAATEEVGGDGHSLLRAYTLGWELLIRLGLASQGSLQATGFQATSAAGPFAAALAAGLAHGDPADVMTNALGIAGIQPGGNFAFLATAATVKAAQPGWAAHAGLVAAALARSGVTGPASVFEGRSGFFELYGNDGAAADRLRESLDSVGRTWELPAAAFKAHPCCHFIHPYLECLDQLSDRIGGERIERVRCAVPVEQMPVIADPWAGKQHPASGHDARWSLPYVLAARLRYGSVDLDLFDGPARPEICALAERITVEPWHQSGYPARFPARLSVTLAAGTTLDATVDDVRGGPARPLDTCEVLRKFHANAAAGGLTDAEAKGLADAILGVVAPDVSTIANALQTPTDR
ncbi:MAG: MmgE/PrpD family protein [Streptosporangiales bacterium]